MLLAPVCRDEEIAVHGRSIVRAGGAGLYAAWALAKLGARAILHTPLAERDRDLLRFLPEETEVVIHPSRETTCFRIDVDPRNPNERTLALLATSDPLDPGLLCGIEDSAYAFLGPLLPTDLGDPLAAVLRGMTIPIDLGVQGLVRSVDVSGRVDLVPATQIGRLPPLRVLAGDEDEIARAAGSSDVDAASRALAEKIAREVVVTRGDRGATLILRGESEALEVPAVPLRGSAGRAIGLGDTFLAVYGWWRHLGAGSADAGSRAAIAASELLARGLGR